MTDGETGHHHLEKREGSTYMLSKTFTRRIFGIMAALLAIALACAMPCLAFAADDSLGSVDEPAKSADGNAGEQKTVNGVTVDYDTDGKYWAFYVDGEYAATGVDSTDITAGATYTFKAE